VWLAGPRSLLMRAPSCRPQGDVAPELLAGKIDHVGGSIGSVPGGDHVVAQRSDAQDPAAGGDGRTIGRPCSARMRDEHALGYSIQPGDHVATRSEDGRVGMEGHYVMCT